LKYSRRKGGEGEEEEGVWDDIDGVLKGSARARRSARRGGRGIKEDEKESGEVDRADDTRVVVESAGLEDGNGGRSMANGTAEDGQELAGALGTVLMPSARARRRSNRTDHAGNGGEGGDGQLLGDLAATTSTRLKARTKLEKRKPASERKRVTLNGDRHERAEAAKLDHGELVDEPDAMDLDTREDPTLEEVLTRSSIEAGTKHPMMKHDSKFAQLKAIVYEKLTQRRPVPLSGLDGEYEKVHHLIEQTVTAGEGNSMLIIGARGSGKTTLVNQAMSNLIREHSASFHVIRLNGFIHTDDKLALREIWRQLGREMEIEEDGTGKSYADTLAKLLALLSHPAELSGEETEAVAKSIVFIIDEFDLFALHPRQTLLYNLFDVAQSRKAPIAVLGLTTRIDVAESLEKRVKSRFSHRYVHLSLAKSLTGFQEICKAALTISQEELNFDGRAALLDTPSKTPQKGQKPVKAAPNVGLLTSWNRSVDELFADQTFISTMLTPHFYRSKSIGAVLASMLIPIAGLESSTDLTSSILTQPGLHTLSPPDSSLSLIQSLSDLQLALLIATARLDILHDADTANFGLAYAEYSTLVSKVRVQSASSGAIASGAGSRVFSKNVARGAWEGLVEMGLLVPVLGGHGIMGGVARGMVRCDVSLEEIGEVVRGMGVGATVERWCRQL